MDVPISAIVAYSLLILFAIVTTYFTHVRSNKRK